MRKKKKGGGGGGESEFFLHDFFLVFENHTKNKEQNQRQNDCIYHKHA